MTTKFDRTLGAFLGCAIGDSMAAPTECRPTYLIKQDIGNGGYVFDYTTPLDSTLCAGLPKGIVTDDFSISYLLSTEFLKDGGITKEGSERALIEWTKYDEYFLPHSGPSTREAIAKLMGYYLITGEPYDDHKDSIFSPSFINNSYSSNGAGMKAFVAGVFNPGNMDKAIDDLIILAGVTHPNPVALSAGSAVASAVAAAMLKNSTLDKVIDAGLYGAREGLKRAGKLYPSVTGSNAEERIKIAVALGIKHSNDFDKLITEMSDDIGIGIRATEVVPAAFGFLAASGGDMMKAIHMSINVGDDTDTVGAIVGAMCGAYSGFSSVENGQHHIDFIGGVNKMDIRGIAEKVNAFTD